MNIEDKKLYDNSENIWQLILHTINTFVGNRTGKEPLSQIIKDGLKVYTIFPGCNGVSLFMIEEEANEFYYSSSYPMLDIKTNNELFNSIEKQGIIENVKKSCKPQVYNTQNSNKENVFYLVVPLINHEGIIGVVILFLNSDPVTYEQLLYELLYQHTSSFAMILHCFRISNDINNAETLFNQRVASRTVELEKTRRELKVILDSIFTGILMVDRSNQKIIRANQTAIELLGVDKEEIIEKQVTEFITPSSEEAQSNKYVEEVITNEKGEVIPIFRKTIDLLSKGFDFKIENFIDIRELKKAEEAVRSSEESYRKLFDSVSDAIYIQSKDGTFLDVNLGAVKLYGYEREEFYGKDPMFLSAEGMNDLEETKKHIEKAFEGTPQQFEFWGKRKNGEIFKKEIVLNKGYYFGKEVVIASARDITERKKVEEKIRESEQLFRSVWECSSEGMRLTDKDGIIRSVNNSFCQMVEKTREEIEGRSFSILYGDEDYQNSDKKYVARFNKGEIKQFFESEVTFWNNKKKWVALSNSFITVDENRKYLLSIFRDITERKKHENLQNALYDISESASSSVTLKELYTKIHLIVKNLMPANNFYIAQYDAGEDILSFPYFVDEFDEAPLPRKPLNGLTEYVLRTGKILLATKEVDEKLRIAGEVEIIGEPSEIWMGVPLKVDEKVFGVLVVQDYKNQNIYGETERQVLYFISEQIASAIYRKKSEEELLRFNEELKQNKLLLEERAIELSILNEQLLSSEKELKDVIKEKDKFFSIISHDLRSPFHGLLGFGEILINEFEELSKEDIKKFIERIYSSSKNLYNLLNNLLEWSKLRTNKVDYSPDVFRIKDVVNSVIEILAGNAFKKRINLYNNAGNRHMVFADQNMIYSVLQNLISNAIKFTHPDGMITIETKEISGRIEISVSDTGIGISEKEIKKLFEFNAFHSTKGTAEEMGSGLGLVLCKELIEKNGGIFSAKSNPGKGSTFTFTLPQK